MFVVVLFYILIQKIFEWEHVLIYFLFHVFPSDSSNLIQ